MNDLVSKQAVLDAIEKVNWFTVTMDSNTPFPDGTLKTIGAVSVNISIDAFRNAVKDVPTVSEQDIQALCNIGRYGDWINVKDSLPEESESMFARFHATEKWERAMWKKESEAVLVCVRFPDGWRKVTVGRTHDGEWSTSVSKVLPHEVTHWMPLPELPKEE